MRVQKALLLRGLRHMANDYQSWTHGLKRVGLYYSGFVDNLEDVLEMHRRSTLTTYGTRTSKKPSVPRAAASSENDAVANKINNINIK